MASVASPLPRWEFLGDQALLATCRSEEYAQRLGESIRGRGLEFVQDVVIAYQTLAVFVEITRANLAEALREVKRVRLGKTSTLSREHRLPCCYELGMDLQETADALELEVEQLIERHTATEFTVYAIGFSPGFPYLGWLPKSLQGIRRRSEPRTQVPAGSVAMVGKQSAIYPQSTPGGWALIGKTPLVLVNVAEEYFPLRVGDKVRFYRVDETEFQQLLGNRLPMSG